MPRKEKAQEKARNSFKKVPCVIGFDQSYTRTGISIAVNGKLKKVTSEPFKGLTNKSLKRIKTLLQIWNKIWISSIERIKRMGEAKT